MAPRHRLALVLLVAAACTRCTAERATVATQAGSAPTPAAGTVEAPTPGSAAGTVAASPATAAATTTPPALAAVTVPPPSPEVAPAAGSAAVSAAPLVDVSPAAAAAVASPAPADPASPAQSPAPALAVRVADLGVAMAERSGETRLYHADAQASVGADWADSDDLETPRIGAGETLYGIGPEGVATWTTALAKRHVLLRRDGATPPARPTLHLMTKMHRPSPGARLEARPLAPVTAGKQPLRAWVTRQIGQPMAAVGELRGVFGGGVDRIVVFKAVRPIDFNDDEPQGEVALLVASGTPRALLALGGGLLTTLRPAAVFDLDGDGVEEVLWLAQELASDGSGPLLQVSYFAADEHRVHLVLSRSYSDVDEFGGVGRRRSKR